MKKTCVVFSILLVLNSNQGWTQNAASGAAAGQATGSAPKKVMYKAAAGSAPAARVTGGSRGSGDAAVRLDVLAPDETGLTTQEQPSLFWYQSKPAEASFELTLLDENQIKPVLQVKMEKSVKAGIQRIKLSDHGVKLEKDVEYRWVVALITDPKNWSKDLVASGFVKRIEPSLELQDKLGKAKADEKAAIYAEAGIWHDALASLSDQIEAEPASLELKTQRADLLKQVGLSFAAASEGLK